MEENEQLGLGSRDRKSAWGPGGRVTPGSLSLAQVSGTAWPELDSGMCAIGQLSEGLLQNCWETGNP